MKNKICVCCEQHKAIYNNLMCLGCNQSIELYDEHIAKNFTLAELDDTLLTQRANAIMERERLGTAGVIKAVENKQVFTAQKYHRLVYANKKEADPDKYKKINQANYIKRLKNNPNFAKDYELKRLAANPNYIKEKQAKVLSYYHKNKYKDHNEQ